MAWPLYLSLSLSTHIIYFNIISAAFRAITGNNGRPCLEKMTGHYFDAYQRLKKSEIIVSNLFIIPIHPIEPLSVLYMTLGYYRTWRAVVLFCSFRRGMILLWLFLWTWCEEQSCRQVYVKIWKIPDGEGTTTFLSISLNSQQPIESILDPD